MAEVYTRTLHTSAVPGSPQGGARVFDIRSWQGLTEILRAAKASPMTPDEYADFRDAVLQYSSSGGSDQTLRATIESVITANRLSPLAPSMPSAEPQTISTNTPPPQTDAASEHHAVLGTMRPRPSFDTAVAQQASVPPEPSSTATPSAHFEPDPVVAPDTIPARVLPESAAPSDVSVPETAPTPTPRPDAPVTSGVISNAPVPTIDDYRARIQEIKRTVNAHVGNPVMLIDNANALGRTYMSALLSAMKAVSGGAPGTLTTSMGTLEKVFQEIMLIPAAQLRATADPSPSEPVPSTPMPESSPVVNRVQPSMSAPEPAEETQPSPLPPAAVSVADRVSVAASVPHTIPEQFVSIQSKVPSMKAAPSAQTPPQSPGTAAPDMPRKQAQAIPSLADLLKRDRDSIIPDAPQVRNEPKPQLSVQREAPAPQRSATTVTPPARKRPQSDTPTVAPSQSTSEYAAAPLTSLRSLTEQPVASSEKRSMVGDMNAPIPAKTKKSIERELVDVPASVGENLNAPEVTAGLHQLLDEWKLFRSGGIFSSKAAGYDHPLYRKLAPMPMSIVATGTWDAAEKEQVLSIRDYINGWLHEQAVSYIPTESFENYLRRVVKRMLKRQQN